MATVYPSASGSWSDTSLWMEVGGNPYNQIPQVDDVVYLNGCTMTANMNIDLGTNGEIRNDGDDGQGITAGGYIEYTVSGRTIIANLFINDINILRATNAAPTTTIVGNVTVIGGATSIMVSTANANGAQISITGDIHLGAAVFCDRIRLHFVIVGDIYAEHGYFQNISPQYTYTRRITGNIYLGDSGTSLFSASSNTGNPFSVVGNIVGSSQTLVGGGNEQSNSGNPISIDGNVTLNNSTLFSHGVDYFNMNGTLTQGQGQIASYITTLNLDGTLNLSGTRPFTTGVQNLNVATGGSVTYDNHLYYCFSNIVAVDSNFTITCRNQNLDNFDFKNKNLLNNTYPAQANVSDGYVYGLEDQFTGSYQLPPESVVLEGTPYGSHVGTLTLDISSSVQDTIDDIEDEVNILVDSYPPLVTLESITNIGNTSATINLSVSNTALITKTGAEVDTDWNFSNPQVTEVSNYVSSVNVIGLIPDTKSYARAYVVYDNKKVYSQSDNLSTLLIPSQLQLCEYLQTDGSAYANIQEVIGNDIYSLTTKCYCNTNTRYIWWVRYSGMTNTFDLTVQNTGKYNSRIFRNANTASNLDKGNVVTFRFNRNEKEVWFNSQRITFTHTLGNNSGYLTLFTPSESASGIGFIIGFLMLQGFIQPM